MPIKCFFLFPAPILCKCSRSQKVITSKVIKMLEVCCDFSYFICSIWQVTRVTAIYGKILLSIRSIYKPEWMIELTYSLLEVFKLLVCDESRPLLLICGHFAEHTTIVSTIENTELIHVIVAV